MQAIASGKSESLMKFRLAHEERRRRHNEEQEARGNVRVYCRVRPVKSSVDTCVTTGSVETYNPGQVQ